MENIKISKTNGENGLDTYVIEGIDNPIVAKDFSELVEILQKNHFDIYKKMLNDRKETLKAEAEITKKAPVENVKVYRKPKNIKAIIATATAALIMLSSVSTLSACRQATKGETGSSISQDDDLDALNVANTSDKIYTYEELCNMNFDQLDKLYNDQVISMEDYMRVLYNVSNNLNNSYFSGLGSLDNKANCQLFVTPDELRGFFNIMNADVLSAEEFEDMYGNNSCFIDPSQDGENTIHMYEYMTKSYLIANFKGKEIKNDISSLFLSKSLDGKFNTTSKELIDTYQAKLSEIATTSDYNAKKQKLSDLIVWVQKLKNYDQKDAKTHDAANQNALSYIYSTFQTYVVSMNVDYNFGLLRDDGTVNLDEVTDFTLAQLVATSGQEHCALLENLKDKYSIILSYDNAIKTGSSEELKQAQENAKNIILAMSQKQYALIKDDIDRDVQISKDNATSYISDNITNILGSSQTTSKKSSVSSSSSAKKTSITRQLAVSTFGEQKVADAEAKAKAECEKNVAEYNYQASYNAKQFSEQYNKDYQAAYEEAATTGNKNNSSTGATNGSNDAQKEYDAKLEAEKNNQNQTGTKTETPVTSSNPDTSKGEEKDPNPGSAQTEKPVVTIIPGGQVVGTTTTVTQGTPVPNPTAAPTTAPVVTPAPTTAPVATPVPTSNVNVNVSETPVTSANPETGEEIDPDFASEQVVTEQSEIVDVAPVSIEAAETPVTIENVEDKYAAPLEGMYGAGVSLYQINDLSNYLDEATTRLRK